MGLLEDLGEILPNNRIKIALIAKKLNKTDEETRKLLMDILESRPSLGHLDVINEEFIRNKDIKQEMDDLTKELVAVYNEYSSYSDSVIEKAKTSEKLISKTEQLLKKIAETTNIVYEDSFEDIDVTALNPEQLDALKNIVIVLTTKKDDKLLKLGSRDLWFNLGLIADKLHWSNETEILYQTALTHKPDDTKIWYYLGGLMFNQQQFPEAEQAYRSALKFKPDYAKAWQNLGNLLANQQRFPEAEQAFQAALKYKSDYAIAWYNLGTLMKIQQRFPEAEQAYQ